MVTELFSIIQSISGDADAAYPQHSLLRNANLAQTASPVNHLRPESRRRRIAWTLRGREKRRTQVEEFGTFVQLLYDVVPPDVESDGQGDGASTRMRHRSDRLQGL
jgi:hypothetical protein